MKIYGMSATPLENDMIVGYSSGRLETYEICEYYLKRKYLKDEWDCPFAPCLYGNPFYFMHIELFQSVINPLYLRPKNNIVCTLLDITPGEYKSILSGEKYYILCDFDRRFEVTKIVNYLDYCRIKEYGWNMELATGVGAIITLLQTLNLRMTLNELRDECEKYIAKGKNIPQKLQKRIDVVEYLIKNDISPASMIVSSILVPNIDELLKKETGRLRSDLKGLYYDIIVRNNRIKTLVSIAAPDVIKVNEERLLQGLVDDLYKKCYKAFGCEDEVAVTTYAQAQYENVVQSMFLFADGESFMNKAGMVAAIMNMQVHQDFTARMDFYGFLGDHNSIEDKHVWAGVQEELRE